MQIKSQTGVWSENKVRSILSSHPLFESYNKLQPKSKTIPELKDTATDLVCLATEIN